MVLLKRSGFQLVVRRPRLDPDKYLLVREMVFKIDRGAEVGFRGSRRCSPWLARGPPKAGLAASFVYSFIIFTEKKK